MLVFSSLLAVCLSLPAVRSFDSFLTHQKKHESGSLRHLKAKETVHDSGNDLVFTWAKCVICDGYDARLYLQDNSGKQEIPYILKSAVTALKVPNVSPRTVYKLVIKRLPTDPSSSEVSGRTSSPEAPPAVEELVARAVTTTSIKIEWKSKNADGFIARIFRNNSMIQEKVISVFKNHTRLDIRNLAAETEYKVQVTAFYFPPGGNSISAVSLAWVKTLPLVLPQIDLKWKLSTLPEIHWVNPKFPEPVLHELTCTRSSGPIFGARTSGSANTMVLTNVDMTSSMHCALKTWFSESETSKVISRVDIQKPTEYSPPPSAQIDKVPCGGGYSQQITTSGTIVVQQRAGAEWLKLKLSYVPSPNLEFHEMQYKFCEGNGFCDDAWVTSRNYSEVIVDPGDIKPWTSYRVFFRFLINVTCNSDSRYYSNSRYYSDYSSTETRTTTYGSVVVPPLLGVVDPVRQILGKASEVSWEYDSSSVSPDYFLVTHCNGDSCTSQSVPGQDRSLSSGKLKERHVYFVTVQAVKLRDGKAYMSATEMTSIVAPTTTTADVVTLSFTESSNSSTVRLHIAHNHTSDTPPVVEYHVSVCSKPVYLWNDPAIAELLRSNETCDSMVSTNASLDLIRQPWTSYVVSAFLCYDSFDFNDPVNLTLPIFKPLPSPLDELSWDAKESTLKWKYDSSLPSGFSISICPEDREGGKCENAVRGPLDRQYSVVTSPLIGHDFVATVYPYVSHDSLYYNGTSSEVTLSIPTPMSSDDPEEELASA